MPWQLPDTGTDVLELAEFVARADQAGALRSVDELRALAPPLQALARNRGFLERWIRDRARADAAGFQRGSRYNFQTLALHVTEHYLLRANFWPAATDLGRFSAQGIRAVGYQAPHNHNFHLLTVGYSGPGYETDLFRLADHNAEYRSGDPCTLDPLGRWQLATGATFLFEAYADVHTQLLPPQLSVSLNIMSHAVIREGLQYVFDVERGQVAGLVNARLDSRLHVLDLARQAGDADGEATRLLQAIAETDPSARMRQLAARLLAGEGVRYQY
jgi:hypothetical protein